MTRAAAVILDHEVESVGREQQSIKKVGAWVSRAALPTLHKLFLKSFMKEWSHGFLLKPLLFWNYS